jgi:tetratricopeptide (TPR) repeat protein
MILTAWLIFTAVMSAETKDYQSWQSWLKAWLFTLGVSAGLGLIFWLLHSGTLASVARSSAGTMDDVIRQVSRYENLLARFYVFVFTLLAILAYYLPEEKAERARSFNLAGALAGGAGLLVFVLLAAYTNLRVVQADIAFKLAEPFARETQWPVAIAIYNRANALAPREDYYYLFLGRAYLEYAKTLTDAAEREKLIAQAAADLRKAQSINPLNTDHTANLGRLYSLWAGYMSEPQDKQEKASESDHYFSKAVVLSPNSARLWDEWALLYLNVLGKPDEAVDRLEHALDIDPKYHWTYALLAEYHNRNSKSAEDADQQKSELTRAADYYAQALALPTPGEPAAKYNYAVTLAGMKTQLGEMGEAIDAYEQALEVAPKQAEKWRVEETIANLYVQLGDAPNALVHFQNALQLAPQDQIERLNNLVAQFTQP